MNKDTITAFCMGIWFGVLTGVVTAILYAPKSGNVTRHIIREKARDVSASVRGKFGLGELDDVRPFRQ